MPEKYNGWTNYETWNVALWIGNEQGSSEHWQEKAQDAWDGAESDSTFSREENAAGQLAASLRETFESEMWEFLDEAKRSSSCWADLLGAALSEVNWYEIAENYIGDVDKEEEPEEAEAEDA